VVISNLTENGKAAIGKNKKKYYLCSQKKMQKKTDMNK
jgi:hypothetical protein